MPDNKSNNIGDELYRLYSSLEKADEPAVELSNAELSDDLFDADDYSGFDREDYSSEKKSDREIPSESWENGKASTEKPEDEPAEAEKGEAPLGRVESAERTFPEVKSKPEPEKVKYSAVPVKKAVKPEPEPEKEVNTAAEVKADSGAEAAKAKKTAAPKIKHKPERRAKVAEKKEPVPSAPGSYDRSGASRRAGTFISDAPFVTGRRPAYMISLDLIIACLPAVIWAVNLFGARALALITVSVVACVAFEIWFGLLFRKKSDIMNFSSVAQGILLALLMPVSTPLWIPVVAAFVGTLLVKCVLGGLTGITLHPSLAGFAFVTLVLPGYITGYTAPFDRMPFLGGQAAASVPYTLSAVPGAVMPEDSYTNILLGIRSGALGEVSALLLAVGLIYLIIKGTVSWHAPVAFILVAAVGFYTFPMHNLPDKFALVEILCGLLPLTAMLFASDSSFSPVFPGGKLIYGAGCGALTVAFRYAGAGTFSAVYAVLLMNLTARPLDIFLIPAISRTGKKNPERK